MDGDLLVLTTLPTFAVIITSTVLGGLAGATAAAFVFNGKRRLDYEMRDDLEDLENKVEILEEAIKGYGRELDEHIEFG